MRAQYWGNTLCPKTIDDEDKKKKKKTNDQNPGKLSSFSIDKCTGISDDDKIDCGYMGIDKDACDKRGCCWNTNVKNGIPWCFNGMYYV